MKGNSIKVLILIFLGVIVVIQLVLVILDVTKILPFSSILSAVSLQTTKITQKQASQNITPHSFSVTSLSSVPSGDPFKQLVQPPGSTTGLITISGRVTDVFVKNNITYLGMAKDDGTPVAEVAEVFPQAKVILVIPNGTKAIEAPGKISDVKKGESVIVSYNVDMRKKIALITGIRIRK